MTGGAAALASCIAIGPRLFKFIRKNESEEEKNKRELYNHTNFEGNFIPFTASGTLLLWYCWFGFNCGSTHAIVTTDDINHSVNVGLVGINTTIATMGGGFSTLVIHYFVAKASGRRENRYNIGLLCNGLLSGAVAVTAACKNVYPYAAFIIGIIAGFVYYFYQWLIHKLHIDDPLHAGPIHLGTGSWGVVAVGIFDRDYGFLYYGGGYQLGIQLLAVVCIFAWSFAHTFAFFYLFKLCGKLRISEEDELKGTDVMSCGGTMVFNYDEESLKYYARLFRDSLREGNIELNPMGTEYPAVTTTVRNPNNPPQSDKNLKDD
jgi:Amt family ammonium transporter